MNVDLDLVLAGMEDVAVPTSPRADDFIALDQHFVNSDFAIETEDASFAKRDGLGRRWLGKSWSAPGQ